MTLIMGMSKCDGIYMCVDYRVTNSRTGKLIDDAAPKLLDVNYPPPDHGPRAVIAYTGLAVLGDGTATGDWMRETLRGESEVFDDSMVHLKDRLDRDIAPYKQPLMINALVIHGGRRYFAGLSNVFGNGTEVRGYFGYAVEELQQPRLIVNGSGGIHVARGHLDLLQSQLAVRPRRTKDHMNLLASVNRRVAKSDPQKSVSPFCHVSFLNSDERTEPISMTFTEKDETVPFHMPMVLFGVDLSEMTRQHHEHFLAYMNDQKATFEMDREALDREIKRRP